jgi:hypothetical protein
MDEEEINIQYINELVKHVRTVPFVLQGWDSISMGQ